MVDRVLHAVEGRPTQVNLTGGEPLLLPWLSELVGHLSSSPNVEAIHLITNGTADDDGGLVERLAAAQELSAVKVSLESAVSAVNDRVRGRGNLARVEERLEVLRRLGRELVLMVTLGRHNVASVALTVEWARQREFDGIIFERFVPLGRGRAMAESALGPAEWGAAVAAIVAAAGLEATIDELLPYRAFWLSLAPATAEPLSGALCNLGDGSMALMPDGTVFPCRRLPLPQGNVLEDPFDEVLARLASWSSEAVGARLRGEVCGLCGIEECAGCRAMAHAVTGDPLADDPGCVLVAEPGASEG